MSKQYIVVDENDNIVGYKNSKKDIDPQQEYYRVSALRLTNSRWEILIAQRSFNKSHNPGKRWPAVAGTVEKWESYKDNIIKETDEEIWVKDIICITWPKIKHERERKYFGQRFLAVIDKEISEFKIRKEELEAIKRINKMDLLNDINKHPENYLQSMKSYVEMFDHN